MHTHTDQLHTHSEDRSHENVYMQQRTKERKGEEKQVETQRSNQTNMLLPIKGSVALVMPNVDVMVKVSNGRPSSDRMAHSR
jgi:hypothetical protein